MTHVTEHVQEGATDVDAVLPDFSLFKIALDGIGEAVMITDSRLDPPGPVIQYVNPAFCKMTGYSAEEVIGKTPHFLQGPLTERTILDRLRSDLETREAFQATAINYRKDGSTYVFHWHITSLRNQAGELTHWVALQREIKPDTGAGEPVDDGKRRVRQMTSEAAACLAGIASPSGDADHIKDQDGPGLRDLQRQVRDTIAAVRSIARRTADTHDTAEDYIMHFDGRISTLARVKNAAVQTGGYRLELGWLVTQELLAFDVPGENTLKIKGPKIYLRPQSAEVIGLGIHELATNALKFGALSRSGGSVTANWRVESRGKSPQVIFRWMEGGTSELSGPPEKKGFGMRYLERIMPRDLGATAKFHFVPGGLIYELKIPLSGKNDLTC
jgi:PAS domain S-box-containing protein